MPNFAWKNLICNRNRRQFPEVVVPLASSNAPVHSSSESDADKKSVTDDGSNTSIERASCQEKGTAAVPAYSTSLTLEELRAQVENEVSASGHDSVYDRMFLMLSLFKRSLAGLADQSHFPILVQCFGFLTLNHRQGKSHQQSNPGHWYGSLPMGIVCSLRIWLDRRQVSRVCPKPAGNRANKSLMQPLVAGKTGLVESDTSKLITCRVLP